MLTPQEIQEITFAKAVFGGYDMQVVDKFVEPLVDDYITLYNENAVLKSKLKVLVAKLEELRDGEAQAKKELEAARKEAENTLKEAQAEAEKLLQEAENTAAQRNSDAKIAEEALRLDCAKQLALNFIDVLEKDIQGHLDLLENLRQRDLSLETKAAAPVIPAKVEDTQAKKARAIADEIEESLNKMGMVEETPKTPVGVAAAPAPKSPAPPVFEDRPTLKFNDLQFGNKYNPLER